MTTARTRRRVLIGVAAALGLALASAVDGPVYRAIDPSLAGRASLEGRDLYWLFRNVGNYWTWVVLGAGLICLDSLGRGSERRGWRRGVFLMLAPAAAGLGAELLKLVIARERPAIIEGDALVYHGYVFRGLFGGFADGSNLGLPSSHAATAFGGAAALAIIAPPVGPLALGMAAGCGVTRLLTGAHFASDVYAGMVLGVFAAWAVSRALLPGARDRGVA